MYLNTGEITNGHILTTLQFRNTIDKMSIAGRFLREAFEHSVENYDPVTQDGKFLQVSGKQQQQQQQQQQQNNDNSNNNNSNNSNNNKTTTTKQRQRQQQQ